MPLDPVIGGALITGGAAAAQGLISSAFGAHQAEKQQNFQERMSNTSHQREVKDLRAAGLNPILSAKLGGSSTPPGASSSAVSPDVAHSAASGASLSAAIENTRANTALALAQAGDVNATQQSRIELMIAQKTAQLESAAKTGGADTHKIMAEIRNLEAQKALTEVETKSSAYGLQVQKAKAKPFELFNKAVEKVEKDEKWWNPFRKVKTMKSPSGATGRW